MTLLKQGGSLPHIPLVVHRQIRDVFMHRGGSSMKTHPIDPTLAATVHPTKSEEIRQPTGNREEFDRNLANFLLISCQFLGFPWILLRALWWQELGCWVGIEEAAVLECRQCEELLCKPCAKRLHSRGKMLAHELVRLGSRTHDMISLGTASSLSTCLDCYTFCQP